MSHPAKSLKKDLRSAVIAETLSHSEGERTLRSEKIQNNLSDFMKTQSGFWGAFKSLDSEPQINFDSLSSNVKCCYPKVVGDDLEFYADVDQWNSSGLKVQEPASGKKVKLSELSGIFVPALAFHADGHRLGRGKGFYDRTLADFTNLKVGVCFQFNILNSVPTESHDVGMDYIITDEKIIQPKVKDQRSWN
ncbi:5-formyltetrahydrofolate cyclo-ligase [Bdellovibrio sp. qaytius]|nr:5-formyltetrahydrofolate cyclo-ligase [Bdellovibrio sp. qaytius]